MSHYSKYKIAIIGFGIEGQDSARYFLGQHSKKITVFDKVPKENLSYAEYERKGIEFICGPDYLSKGLKDYDYIVRSPGVYRYLPEIVEAEKSGVKITSNTQLFSEESEANIIGITGTKGKGTTAQMLKLGLEAGGKKVLLLGNIGTPMLDRIEDADTFDWVILELSSFQLVDLTISPRIAIVTNITTDHLNWHKDRDEYIHAKENLWIHQKPTDWVIFNWDDPTCRELAKNAPGQKLWFSVNEPLEKGTYCSHHSVVIAPNDDVAGDIYELQVPGKHNVYNAIAALTAAYAAGVKPLTAWWGDPHKNGKSFEYEGICGYKGSEHRLEEVAVINGVTYVNDSAATTPESAIAAIRSYNRPKVLIAGGSLKGVPFKKFVQSIKDTNVKAVFLIGESADEIRKELEEIDYAGRIFADLEDMEEIVKEATKLSKKGDMILLSPGCASFGLFKDYKDRGEQFKKAVLDLKGTNI